MYDANLSLDDYERAVSKMMQGELSSTASESETPHRANNMSQTRKCVALDSSKHSPRLFGVSNEMSVLQVSPRRSPRHAGAINHSRCITSISPRISPRQYGASSHRYNSSDSPRRSPHHYGPSSHKYNASYTPRRSPPQSRSSSQTMERNSPGPTGAGNVRRPLQFMTKSGELTLEMSLLDD
jgi:hypothetical protein